jgi:hypothetical protein
MAPVGEEPIPLNDQPLLHAEQLQNAQIRRGRVVREIVGGNVGEGKIAGQMDRKIVVGLKTILGHLKGHTKWMNKMN